MEPATTGFIQEGRSSQTWDSHRTTDRAIKSGNRFSRLKEFYGPYESPAKATA
jgi:hypothetical protein